MKNKIISITFLILFILLFTPSVFATVDADGNEIIEIEDEVFKRSICYNVDYNGDGEISVVEIKDLRSCSIPPNVTNIDFLNYAENLSTINFFNYTGENLNVLNFLNETIKNQINSISIYEVSGGKTSLSDISALSEFNNLNILMISGFYQSKCNLSDITPIQNLTQLSYLDISNTCISDISCLNKLTNLTSLYLNNNEITSIDVISNFTNLTDLYARENNIVDVSAISNLINLRNIDFYKNKITNIPDLSKISFFTNQEMNGLLCLSYNEIEDISGIAYTNLKGIDLSYNKIKDISPLLKLQNSVLSYINLSNNLLDASCIDIFSQLKEIGSLYIDDNNISGTITLSEINANDIWLNRNLIETIIVDGNERLSCLGMSYSKNLKTISIKNMKNLHDIYAYKSPKLENVTISNINSDAYIQILLHDCNISDLSGLSSIASENFRNQIRLNLNNNKIKDISPLASNMYLKQIELIDNNINPYTEETKAIIYTLAEYGCTDLYFGDCSRFLNENIVTEETKKEIVNVKVNGTNVTAIPSVKGTDILEFINKKFVKNDNYDVIIVSQKGEIKKDGMIGSRDVVTIRDENNNQFSYIVVVPGDVTGNGYIRMYDSFEILKGAVTGNKGLDEIDYLIRDYNQDGNIRMYDAFQYLREAVSGK